MIVFLLGVTSAQSPNFWSTVIQPPAGTGDYPADFSPVTLIPLLTHTLVNGEEECSSQKDDP